MVKSMKKTMVLVLAAAVLLGTVPALAAENSVTGGIGLRIGKLCGSMGTAITELLGISATELCEARQSGKSLAELAAEKGIEKETVVDTLIVARRQSLQELVAAGKITQEQADACLENMKARVEDNIESNISGNSSQGRKGCGMGGGFGKGMQRGFSNQF